MESCSLTEPSSRQASSSPSGAHRVHRAGEGEERAAEASWEGALSIRNDKWISSAPDLGPGTFLRAEALRDPSDDGTLVLCGGWPDLAPLRSCPDPLRLRGGRGAEGGTKAGSEPWRQKRGDAETDGKRQTCVHREAPESAPESGRKADMQTETKMEKGQRKHSRAKTQPTAVKATGWGWGP